MDILDKAHTNKAKEKTDELFDRVAQEPEKRVKGGAKRKPMKCCSRYNISQHRRNWLQRLTVKIIKCNGFLPLFFGIKPPESSEEKKRVHRLDKK